MNKNHIAILLLLCLISTSLIGQSDSLNVKQKKDIGLQIGTDASIGLFLLTNFFGSSSFDFFDLYDENPNYFIFVKYKFLRLQFGTNFKGIIRENDDVDFPTNRVEQFNNDIFIKFGTEHSIKLNPKFNFFAGANFIYHFSNRKQIRKFELAYGSDIRTSVENLILFGPGAHCGLEWFVAKRLSLSTEASFNFLFENDIEKEFSEEFPDTLGTKEVEKSYQTQQDIPFLNLLLRFKI